MGVDVIGLGGERGVTKSNTAGEAALGSVAVTPVSGTTAWGQVSASLSADTLVTKVTVELSAGSFNLAGASVVDIGLGGSGAEVVKATTPLRLNYGPGTGTARVAIGDWLIPLRAGSGQRLAVRLTDTNASSGTATITVYGMAYANLEGN